MGAHTKIKICGLTTPQDAGILGDYDINLAGIVLFHEKSKRNVSAGRAGEILSRLPKTVKSVAVVVSPTLEQTILIRELGFDYLQIHGKADDELLRAAPLPILRAVQIGENGLPKLESAPAIVGYVIDSAVPGSGKVFDWSTLTTDRPAIPYLLAGGLSPDNVGAAISLLHPDGVDVSSAVESANRTGKDPEKIAAFVEAVRRADRNQS